MNREDIDIAEARRVLRLSTLEKADTVAPVKLQLSLLNFLRKQGKVSPFIRQAVIEKLRRMINE